MKKAVPFLLYPILGLAAGWASIGRVGSSAGSADGGARRDVSTASSRHREARETLPPPSTAELLEMVRQEARAGAASRGASGRSARELSDDELLEALGKAVKNPAALLEYNSPALILLQEYAARDPDGALAWSMALPPILRGKCIGAVLRAWPVQRVDEALAFVRSHRDLMGHEMPMSLVSKAISSALAGGPQAVLARLQELTGDGFNRLVTFPKDVPKDFDFAGLLDSPEFAELKLEHMHSTMIQTWVRQDREAAYAWMVGKEGPEAMFGLRPKSWETTPEKSAELTRWMVGKVDALPEDQQLAFAKAARNKLIQQDGDALIWINSVKNPALRDALRTAAASALYIAGEDYVDRGLQALATLPDGASRVQVVETMMRDRPKESFRWDPSPGAENLLRARLADWGAEPARIDAILKDYLRDRVTARPKN